ncbi:cation:proton antiporter [Legionella bozemanae]|uniref:Monovalent cation:proton antiporter (CPA2 family) n=1 Tax=Legionella bozemanae TaxID=447 RepID=A0A0W0RIN6_LEGBO|nr:cation:proton antiporter [Legionella bozemanae]KTC70921.1 monovalent cation:proton antiporter (CPA2 family) [Legionella bozemanae]STO34807.1 Inner membrane protein ybaL [Legionella bozemanae]
MHHALPLITTVAMGFALALILGFIAVRFKIPALVGYLLAGVAMGPFTPGGLMADVEIAQELAEIGVMLLMFGVGLHFSLSDLLYVRKIAIPGAIVQMIVATILGGCTAIMWGWNYGYALIFGLSLSVASTVVLLRALEERGMLGTINGHIAVGWLLVEDLAMVVVLVLLPPLSQWLGNNPSVSMHKPLWLVLGLTFIKVSTFIALMFLVGRRFFPKLLWHVARTGSRELFTLCVVTAAISIAYVAAKLFGVSFALGAFFAGMIMRESAFSHRAAEELLPLRDAFAVLFFVSVGMLFNPAVLVEQPLQVLTVVGIIVIGKSIAAFILVLAFRYPLQSALVVSASLAQIGEFSFILAELGIRLGLLPVEGRNFILAGALISIAINPLIFKLITPIHTWAKTRSKLMEIFERSKDPLTELPITTTEKYLAGHVVLIGYGRVGKRVARLLSEKDVPYVVIDDNRELIERLRVSGIPAVYGDASKPSVLVQSHIAHASMLIIVISDTVHVGKMIQYAIQLNPGIEIVIRTHNEEEAMLLQKEINGKVFFAEGEIAKNMGLYALNRYGKSPTSKN